MKSIFRAVLTAIIAAALWTVGVQAEDSTPYGGKPQEIPGMIVPGCYDQGGAGVAFEMLRPWDLKMSPDLNFRAGEFGYSGDQNHALAMSTYISRWITYTVVVQKAGEYDVELFLNRPDYFTSDKYTGVLNDGSGKDVFFQLDVDGKMLADWKINSKWDSGVPWRSPSKSVGRKKVSLTAGQHKLIIRADRVTVEGFHFGGLQFSPAIVGTAMLPGKAMVFAPFTREDGVPAPELLRSVPATLKIGDKQAEGRTADFGSNRILDLASFTGIKAGGTAWVYLPFEAETPAPTTFGFGADWWYEAYLDGALISETLSGKGNGTWPPSIHDFTTTVEMAKGAHVLAIRMIRGTSSAMLAVGGPEDLRNITVRIIPRNLVTKAGYREGPPSNKKWKMVWHDEFDGTSLDTDKWFVPATGSWDWPGMKTKPSMSNLFLDGKGSLVLQLTQDPDGTVRFPSGVRGRFEKAYGYFETRVQFSRQPGWDTAVVLDGWPYDCGADAFVHPQEFDIFEDFYKPKRENDVAQAYHFNIHQDTIAGDQGNAKGVGEGGMLVSRKLFRTSSGNKTVMEQYEGWHTVGFQWTPLEYIFYMDGQETLRQNYHVVPMTNVPHKIAIGAAFRVPLSEDGNPFYGRLEEAKFPDSLVVDYLRIYDEDTGDRKPPRVTLAGKGPVKQGEPVTFDVTADADGKVAEIMLFSMGRIRAEKKVGASTVKTSFTVDNLFPNATNTVIAMARDDSGLIGQSAPLSIEVVTGREFTGTAYQGNPQKIPGTVQGGCYDEGGNGIAYKSTRGKPGNPNVVYRKSELGDAPEAVQVGWDFAHWITYEVEVAAAGEYEVELFMNRTTYYKKLYGDRYPVSVKDETIRLNLGKDGEAGTTLLKWPLSTAWDSGEGWLAPQKSLGKQTIRLSAGRYKIVMFFDEITDMATWFCKLVFRPVAKQE
ncbi:MAG: family 16 glycosylhydrolase [Victivallales bacterium]